VIKPKLLIRRTLIFMKFIQNNYIKYVSKERTKWYTRKMFTVWHITSSLLRNRYYSASDKVPRNQAMRNYSWNNKKLSKSLGWRTLPSAPSEGRLAWPCAAGNRVMSINLVFDGLYIASHVKAGSVPSGSRCSVRGFSTNLTCPRSGYVNPDVF